MTSDTGVKTAQCGKDSFFNKWRRERWTSTCTAMRFGALPSTVHKNELKWIENLKVRTKTIRLLEENTGQELHDRDLAMIS